MKVSTINKTERQTIFKLSQADVLEAIQVWLEEKKLAQMLTWDDLDWNMQEGYNDCVMLDDPCLTVTLVETSHDES